MFLFNKNKPFTILSWNILHTKEFLAMMELVHDSKADIVCIQEGTKKELKKDTNEIQWFSNAYSKYYPNDYYIKNIENIINSTNRIIMSKFPFFFTPPHLQQLGYYVLIHDQPVFICNVHLSPGVLFDVKNAMMNSYTEQGTITNTEYLVQRSNKTRGLQIDFILNKLKTIPKDIPQFLLGDFNEISCKDHIDHYSLYNVKFPSTCKILENGFKDSFRQIYPNSENKGFTWNAMNLYTMPDNCPKDRTKYNKPNQRIDFIFYKNNIDIKKFRLITTYEKLYCNFFPSDHFPLLGTYTIKTNNSQKNKQEILKYKNETKDKILNQYMRDLSSEEETKLFTKKDINIWISVVLLILFCIIIFLVFNIYFKK